MIPRRRWPIHARDFTAWLRAALTPWTAKDRHAVAAFEEAFRNYLGCPFARATCSGRDAMELALDAVGLKGGDEIIIPAYTLGELLPCLQDKGLLPVPADIEADTFNIDPAAVEKRVGPKTRAVLVLHLHGAPCDIEALCAIARRHDLRVIEDCAHALGASVGGRKVGTFGDAGFFSLESNKALPTYGGGIVVLRDPRNAGPVTSALARRRQSKWPVLKKALTYWKEEAVIRSPLYGPLARVLFSPKFSGLLERMYRGSHNKLRRKTAYTGFQARLGLERLGRLDERNDRLNKLSDRLAAALPEGFVAQKRDRIGTPAFYSFVALSRRVPPATLRPLLHRKGVDAGIGREVMDDCAAILGATDCPVAARVFSQAVMLPLYDGLGERRFDRVVRALREVASAGPS